ncbi:UDP-N-acetylmuramoyl-L-alanyl-D-glutamate--2,6-diaminopimelate ligase [Candidatus Pandoraea novymonadis]|nr:UDP-N-acetylmuramoyl-L-alanyl-D-glutamate--2,6-diaminopimelate ligase [Candidatus Pandoraea novymonadis]
MSMLDLSSQRSALQTAYDWLCEHVPAGAVLCADTRRVRPGDVFLAYSVGGVDNRQFIFDAVECGAGAIVWQTGHFEWPAVLTDVPHCGVANLNQLAGSLVALWCGEPSDAMLTIGVTGTNGKTSCSQWLAQLLTKIDKCTAVIGTLGSGFPGQLSETGFTTPDAAQLQHSLADFRAHGAEAVVMEVSSHALHQDRVAGVAFDVAVFTNLTQDHLDYHGTMAAYEANKTRLFDWPGLSAAVINRDDAMGKRLLRRLAGKTPVIEYGIGGPITSSYGHRVLRATDVHTMFVGTSFMLNWDDRIIPLSVPLIGDFNISNVLAVLGAALASGVHVDFERVVLPSLMSVSGRMELISQAADQPLIIVDFAHTPDALDKTLRALRSVAHARQGSLVCLFGCGGDRDPSKRPLMGAVAEQFADVIVLTSDNPRSESPAKIIAQITTGCRVPALVRCIEDRASAILQVIGGVNPTDVVLIAGKGHENTQEIMGKKWPFSDQEHARLALAARSTMARGDGE